MLPCYSNALYMIKQDELGVIENLGKFEKVAHPGPIVLHSPCMVSLQAIRRRVDMRLNQLTVKCETKTKDSVFCTVEVTVQYRIHLTNPDEAVVSATYKVENFEALLSDQVQDIVRQKLSKLDLDRAFLMRTDLQAEVEEKVGEAVADYCYDIVKALVNNFRPSQSVVDMMNGIYVESLGKVVATTHAETRKMIHVMIAQAGSDVKHLRGLGVSLMRKAYLLGMQQCLDDFVKVNTLV